MAEYISRDDVLRKFIEGDGDDEFTEGYNFAVNEYRDKLKAMPASDVQSVKHGKWEYNDKPIFGNPYGRYCCSLCGSAMDSGEDNYCPCCGARMDLGDEKT